MNDGPPTTATPAAAGLASGPPATPASPEADRGLPLELAHAPEIAARLSAWRRRLGADTPSEYGFANLWLFRAAHAYRWHPGPWPALSGRTYDGEHHWFPLHDLREAPDEVVDLALATHDCCYPVPGEVARALDPRRWRVDTNPDDADYLYPADHFRHYRGTRLRKKRNLLRQLLDGGEPEVLPLAADRLPLAMQVLDGWLADKGKAAGEADDGPCREALAHLGTLGLDGWLYVRDGAPIGFTITEALAPGVRVVRFAKGRDAAKGLYPFMFRDHAVRHAAMDWVNFEQDLGLDGFRQAKRAYGPTRQVEKWRVRRQVPTA